MTRGRLWMAVMVTAIFVRLATLGAYPLHDTTEARYSEIARIMVVTGDWVTPRIAVDVPFWAKPPLSTWATAASFEVFGINEFAARLPHLLMLVLSVSILIAVGRREFGDESALAGGAVMMTSVLGFAAAGMVMTDATLTLATTLSLAAFWMTVRQPGSVWRYLFFAGLGLGMLAKGPVALVLVGLPVGVWSLWYRSLAWFLRTFPVLRGSLLLVAISGPWYALAETRTPGFLEYFLVGEHWLRFVDSGWQGNLYGKAHARPRGTIWIYALAAALPWSLIAVNAVVKAARGKLLLPSLTPARTFFLLWMLSPMVFFTLAGNILLAYVLPGIPAFALLMGEWLTRRSPVYAHIAWALPAATVVFLVSGGLDGLAYKSQKTLIAYHDRVTTAPIGYFPSLPYSASFYSGGRASELTSTEDLAAFIAESDGGQVAMKRDALERLPKNVSDCLSRKQLIGRYVLLQTLPGCDSADGEAARLLKDVFIHR